MESKQEHIELIIKYFAGEASPDEIQLLSGLLQSNESFRNEFSAQQKVWNSIEKFKLNKELNLDIEWSKLKNNISQKDAKLISFEPEVQRKTSLTFLKIAASFILIAAVSFVIYYFVSNQTVHQMNLASTTSMVEGTLPDGSVVSLNSNSKIEYPEKFTGNKRAVKLTGQAFFNVTHDKSNPFIIDAGKVYVEVVGTSFYVKTDADGKTLVVVSTGKVAVYSKDNSNNKVYVEPGEKAEFTNAQENITKNPNEDPNFISWKTHKFIFNDASLKEIVSQLNNAYNANIQIEGTTIADCRVTATFDNQSLEAVLNVLEATVNIKVSGSGNNLVISGNGCR